MYGYVSTYYAIITQVEPKKCKEARKNANYYEYNNHYAHKVIIKLSYVS